MADERTAKARRVLALAVAMPTPDIAYNEQVSEDYVRGVVDGALICLNKAEEKALAEKVSTVVGELSRELLRLEASGELSPCESEEDAAFRKAALELAETTLRWEGQ